MPTRRELLTGILAGSFGAAAACGSSAVPGRSAASGLTDLDTLVARLAHDADPNQDYRPPDNAERAALPAALDRLVAADLDPDTFDRLGMDAAAGTDTTGRAFVLAACRSGDQRSWGAVVVDRGAPASALVEVPHLRADRDTENLGLELYRAVPGAVLLIAGAHRRAAGERADVAHRDDSFFHATAMYLGRRGLPELQLHGFDSDSLPDVDAVISPGAGEAGQVTMQVADELTGAGLTVCRAWAGDDCGSLEGRTNEQGRAAARDGRPFVHIELSPEMREPGGDRATVVAALARAAATAR